MQDGEVCNIQNSIKITKQRKRNMLLIMRRKISQWQQPELDTDDRIKRQGHKNKYDNCIQYIQKTKGKIEHVKYIHG